MAAHSLPLFPQDDNPLPPRKRSADYCYSDSTPAKQEGLSAMLNLWFNVVRQSRINAQAKWTFRAEPVLLIDLFAGPGVDPFGNPGSPLIFIQEAERARIDYRLMLFEDDPETAAQLKQTVEPYRACASVYEVRNEFAADYVERSPYRNAIIYCDPSNADIPVGALLRLLQKLPRADVLINLACASYKRQVALPGYEMLGDRLAKLGKEYWLIREPLHKHQWVMLMGMNKVHINNWAGKRIFSMEDARGVAAWERAELTKAQWRAKYQGGLFDGNE